MKFLPNLRRFGKTAGHDRSAYRDYQKRIGNYYLKNYVRPYASGNKILDIGCAEGGVLQAFVNSGFDCAGLEYSEHRVKYAIESGSKKIHFIQGDIEQNELKGKFDIILMLDVIEHLNNKKDALKNIKQALLENGICIISFHSLEDRIVKEKFKSFTKKGVLEIITKKPLTPNEEEMQQNIRSRSARMRVAECIK